MSDLKVLLWDIETAPMLAYIWQAKTEYVHADAITHEVFMLGWAAKWEGEQKVHSDILTPEEALSQDDGRLVEGLAELVREADVLVAHNGDRFDVPMLNNRLLLLGQEPLGPVKTIDTCTQARKSFRLASNKLDYLAQHLGVGQKLNTDFDLWKQCYAGDEKALRRMHSYNRKDVRLLEAVYERLSPYVKGLPRLVDADHQDQRVCPSCGSEELQRRGFHRTNASTFQRLQCQSCSRWCRERTADKTKKVGTVPL